MRARGEALKVDAHLIELAIDAHEESGARVHIHQRIRSFVKDTPTYRLRQKDQALEKVMEIIQTVRFKPEELGKNQRRNMSMAVSEYSFGSREL